MPCSRMPKWSLRPPNSPLSRSSAAPLMRVLVEGSRSAEPPTSAGHELPPPACSTFDRGTRVASGLAGATLEQLLDQAVRQRGAPCASHARGERRGSRARQACERRLPAVVRRAVALGAVAPGARTSSGTKNVGSSGQPSASLVAAPRPRRAARRAPRRCRACVRRAVARCACARRSATGARVSAIAASSAASIAAWSWPSMCCTCQP